MGQFRPNNIKSVVVDKSTESHPREAQQHPKSDALHQLAKTHGHKNK